MSKYGRTTLKRGTMAADLELYEDVDHSVPLVDHFYQRNRMGARCWPLAERKAYLSSLTHPNSIQLLRCLHRRLPDAVRCPPT